jgi:hypothetical protein
MNHRYFVGAVAFAAVVTAATLGIVVTIVALAACGLAMHGNRLLPSVRTMSRPAPRRPPRRRSADVLHRLIPDEPSLVFTTQP